MSDDLAIAGGGRIAVDTASMTRAAAMLADAAAALARIRSGLLVLPGHAPAAVQHLLDGAVLEAAEAVRTADTAADALRVAAIRYGEVESTVEAASTTVAAAVAAAWGAAMRDSIGAGPGGALLLLGGTTAVGVDIVLLRIIGEAVETGRVDPLLDPVLLHTARLALGSADDALRGLVGTETPADLVQDRPDAPLGTRTIAAALALAFGAVGHVHRGVRVRRLAAVPMRPPESLGELADRVPEAHPGEAQVRIERYPDGAGRPRWIVYVTGTATFAPDSAGEPFDMTSNLEAVADRPSASGAAVTGAMRDAGVLPGDRVLLVGHSQGALVASRIAETGRYRAAVVTLGGPTGQIALPADVPVLAVEHAEDPVPVLGGALAGGAAGRRRVVVTRELYGAGNPPEAGALVPSHALTEYSTTLHLAEQSRDPRVLTFERRIDPFLTGATGIASAWRADRVPDATERARSTGAPPARYPTRRGRG